MWRGESNASSRASADEHCVSQCELEGPSTPTTPRRRWAGGRLAAGVLAALAVLVAAAYTLGSERQSPAQAIAKLSAHSMLLWREGEQAATGKGLDAPTGRSKEERSDVQQVWRQQARRQGGQQPEQRRQPAAQSSLLDPTPADLEQCSAVNASGPLFSLYIWVADEHMPTGPAQPGQAPLQRCNLSSPLVWPHRRRGAGTDGSAATPHWAHQLAAPFWVRRAVEDSRRVRLVDDPDDADLVLVDTHCYQSWYYSYLHPKGHKAQPSPALHLWRVHEALAASARFRRRRGADHVVTTAFPGAAWQPFFPACGALRNTLLLVPERAMLCRGEQDGALAGRAALLPYVAVSDLRLPPPPIVGSLRDILLFYRGGCGDLARRGRFSSGKLMRAYVAGALKQLAASFNLTGTVDVDCSCEICANAMPHAELMARLYRSTFCPVLPGDTQSSKRLTEVALAGCLPVFFGPPYHTLPLADEIDYPSFSVFIRLEEQQRHWVLERSGRSSFLQNKTVLDVWAADTELHAYEVPAKGVWEAYEYLRSLPRARVESMQAALERERPKLLYASPSPLPDGLDDNGSSSSSRAPSTGDSGTRGSGGTDGGSSGNSGGAGSNPSSALSRGPSVLGELIVSKLCARAAALRRLRPEQLAVLGPSGAHDS